MKTYDEIKDRAFAQMERVRRAYKGKAAVLIIFVPTLLDENGNETELTPYLEFDDAFEALERNLKNCDAFESYDAYVKAHAVIAKRVSK